MRAGQWWAGRRASRGCAALCGGTHGTALHVSGTMQAQSLKGYALKRRVLLAASWHLAFGTSSAELHNIGCQTWRQGRAVGLQDISA